MSGLPRAASSGMEKLKMAGRLLPALRSPVVHGQSMVIFGYSMRVQKFICQVSEGAKDVSCRYEARSNLPKAGSHRQTHQYSACIHKIRIYERSPLTMIHRLWCN